MAVESRSQPAAAPGRPAEANVDFSVVGDIAGGLWWLAWGSVRMAFRGFDALLSGLLWTLTGRYRAWFAPGWLLVAAVGSMLAPGTAWAWIGLGVWLHVRPARPFRRPRLPLSVRERALVAKVAAGVGLVVDWRLPWGWSVVALALVVAAGSVPWLRGRWVRSPRASEMVRRWQEEVVTRHPELAGEWTEYDPDAEVGVLDLVNAKASVAAGMEEEVEWALNQRGGTVTITDDPRLTRRQVRVAFSKPGDAARFRYWEGPTRQADGRFTMLYGKGNVPLYGRLYMPDGASFISIVAPPGSGKGSAQRVIGLEAALDPSIFVIGVCGKRGKGIGYLKGAFGMPLAKTPAQWLKTIDGVIAEMERRSQDGDEADSFVLRPGKPRILLMIDDLPEVLAACPSVGPKLKRYTAQARSLGMGLCTAKQKGDGPSYGHTTTRSNMLDNGWMWAGPATDQQSRLAMKQGFPFDPGTLPSEKGWAAVMGKHLGDQAIQPGRTLWIPNRTDVEKGFEAPFGTVEDWLERDAVTPELAPEVAAALGLVVPASAGPTEAVVPEPGGSVTITSLPPRPEPQPAARPKPSSPAPKPGSGWARIVEELRKQPGQTARELAAKAGMSKRHASDLLSGHSAEVEQDDQWKWSLK